MPPSNPPPKDGNEYHGRIKQIDNEMWAYFETDYKYLANFQMAIICHGVQPDDMDGTKVYVIHCILETKDFNVCINLADLQSFSTFEKVLKKQQRKDSIVNLDIARAIHLHLYVVKMIEIYEDGPDKQFAIIANKPGYYNYGDTKRVYVLSKEKKLPASIDTTMDETEQLPIVWVGNQANTIQGYVGANVQGPLQLFLTATEKYHGDNFGSALTLFGVCYLSMHRAELLEYGIKTPAAHIVGDLNTGKSKLGEQFRCLFPVQLQPNGEAMITRDPAFSYKLLQNKVAEIGPPIILDPVPVYKPKEQCEMMDSLFEATVKINHQNKHVNKGVGKNVIFIQPNEQKNLPDLNGTARSKIVIIQNIRQKDFNADNNTLHKQIVSNVKEYSGIFSSLVKSYISPSEFADRMDEMEKTLQVCIHF